MEALRTYRSLVGLLLAVCAGVASAIDAASLREAQDNVIAFAGQLCANVSDSSETNILEVDGSVNVKLEGLLKHLASLGIEGSAKYSTTETRGVLQGDLQKALRDRNDCYLGVFDLFARQVLPTLESDPKAALMSGRWKTPDMKGLEFFNVVVRGSRFFGTEFDRDGRPSSTYEGTVANGVFEGKGYMEQQLDRSPKKVFIPQRTEIGPVQLQLTPDGQHLYGFVMVTWHGGRQMASKMDFDRDR